MQRFLTYLIFIIGLLFSVHGTDAYAGITERTILNELDLSELNQTQRTMFKKELAAYTTSLDALAKSDTAQWKKAVKEMLCKIRDGFRIYKLARDKEVEDKITEFDSTAHARVYVLTWVEDAFLNNIFLRLAQAYYETTRPDSYVILKYKYIKSPSYTLDKPLLKPDKPEFELSKNISDKLNKKISELTTVCYNVLNKDLGSGCTIDDKQCGLNFNTSITTALDWLKANAGLVNNSQYIQFLDPAGNSFAVSIVGFDFKIITAVKYGALISFYANKQVYEAKYNEAGDYIGYYDATGKQFAEENFDYPKTYFVVGFEEHNTTAKKASFKIFVDNTNPFKTDKFASKENPKQVNILESLYSDIEKGKLEANIIVDFHKDAVREEQGIIGKASVVLITCADKKSVALASTPEELKKKYKDIKPIEGTSVSFLENGYLVTKKGSEVTATKVSKDDITKMVDRIKSGKTNDKSEILFNTEMRDGKIVTSVSALGYRDNVKANSTALADPKKQKAAIGRDKIIQIQDKQTIKFNEYLQTKNVSDLLAKKPREESGKFPDDKSTVIKESNYWSMLTSITKETVAFIENVEIPQYMYDHTVGAKYNECIINTSPFVSGGGNAVIEEALELPRTILLVTDIALKEEVRNGLVEQFSNLSVTSIKNAIVNSAVDAKDNLTGTLPKNWHWKGKTLTATIIGLFGAAIVKELDDALSFDKVNDKIDELATPIGGLLKKLKKKIDELPEADQKILKADLDDPDFFKYIDEATNPEALIDAWKRVSGHEIRKNKDFLNKVSKLSSAQQEKVGDLYKKLKAPAGMKGKVDFTVEINGKKIYYDKNGFPDFTSYSPAINGKKLNFESRTLVGHANAMTITNNWAIKEFGQNNFQKIINSTKCKIKVDNKWVECTWHHHQDGKSIFPVPTEIHSKALHSGGAAVIERGLQNIFDSPQF